MKQELSYNKLYIGEVYKSQGYLYKHYVVKSIRELDYKSYINIMINNCCLLSGKYISNKSKYINKAYFPISVEYCKENGIENKDFIIFSYNGYKSYVKSNGSEDIKYKVIIKDIIKNRNNIVRINNNYKCDNDILEMNNLRSNYASI